MKRILTYLGLFLICGFQVLSCIIVFHFSLLGRDFYIEHYNEWIRGHIIAVIIVLILHFACLSLLSYLLYKKDTIKDSIKKSAYLMIPSIIIIAIYIICNIDYPLLKW
jgi:phosphoglycerol transferase MdoB-like AlkP superfamily enzyme